MRRRAFLATGAAAALAGCSQLPFGSDDGGGTNVKADNARVEAIGDETYPVLSLSHMAGDAVVPGVGIDLTFLDGDTVVSSIEQFAVVPPGETTLWASAPADTSFDSVRIDDVTALDPARPITDKVSVSDRSIADGVLSARFENKSSSTIELYPYLVGTYRGTAVLPEHSTSGLNAVVLESGQAVKHEATPPHKNADLVDGIEAYPCVLS